MAKLTSLFVLYLAAGQLVGALLTGCEFGVPISFLVRNALGGRKANSAASVKIAGGVLRRLCVGGALTSVWTGVELLYKAMLVQCEATRTGLRGGPADDDDGEDENKDEEEPAEDRDPGRRSVARGKSPRVAVCGGEISSPRADVRAGVAPQNGKWSRKAVGGEGGSRDGCDDDDDDPYESVHREEASKASHHAQGGSRASSARGLSGGGGNLRLMWWENNGAISGPIDNENDDDRAVDISADVDRKSSAEPRVLSTEEAEAGGEDQRGHDHGSSQDSVPCGAAAEHCAASCSLHYYNNNSSDSAACDEDGKDAGSKTDRLGAVDVEIGSGEKEPRGLKRQSSGAGSGPRANSLLNFLADAAAAAISSNVMMTDLSDDSEDNEDGVGNGDDDADYGDGKKPAAVGENPSAWGGEVVKSSDQDAIIAGQGAVSGSLADNRSSLTLRDPPSGLPKVGDLPGVVADKQMDLQKIVQNRGELNANGKLYLLDVVEDGAAQLLSQFPVLNMLGFGGGAADSVGLQSKKPLKPAPQNWGSPSSFSPSTWIDLTGDFSELSNWPVPSDDYQSRGPWPEYA